AALGEIERRQQAVKALAPALEERQRLEANALAASEPTGSRRAPKEAPDPEPLLAWAESAPVLTKRPLLVWAARILPPLTIAGMTLDWGFDRLSYVWLVPFGLQLVALMSAREPAARTF